MHFVYVTSDLYKLFNLGDSRELIIISLVKMKKLRFKAIE